MSESLEMFKAVKRIPGIEIRPTSKEPEYLEVVVKKEALESLNSILRSYLGPAAKNPGKEANLPVEIQGIVDSLGGLRLEQSFFYRQDQNQVLFASLWPWMSNPNKITLKTGVRNFLPGRRHRTPG